MPIFPPKLRPGSSLRVVAPSRSMSIVGEATRAEANRKLARMGLAVSFGRHVDVCDDFASSPVELRIADLHAAFVDPDVDGILTVIGGFNVNQLLGAIDYSLVAANPKVLCGFSDIAALSNALYAQTGLVGYSGPHYSSFGMKHHFEYTQACFEDCVMGGLRPIDVAPSRAWSDDAWFIDQQARSTERNPGWWVLNDGEATGTIVGGNLCTFNLLQGTPFMPSLAGTVVFVEDDDQVKPWDFDRDLVSLLQQPGFSGVQALVIGRFQRASAMTRELLRQIVASKHELRDLPVIANVDFGHTTPTVTFPIGGTVYIAADSSAPQLRLVEY